jgi:c-di-GMP-related signal transduction protein
MKLLLRRDQKSGMMGMGKVVFTLEVRADLTPEEKSNIRKYKLGETMLYERDKIIDKGSGLLGLASRLAFRMMNITVSVNDLENGKKIDCKDIIEMVAVEEQLKEAAKNFKEVLNAAATFGGETVLEV